MDDLVQWLGEQLDEDERIAKAGAREIAERYCPPGEVDEWVARAGHWGVREWVGPRVEADLAQWGVRIEIAAVAAAHIARHDPARVLREIDAKRQIIAQYVEAAQAVDELAAVRERLHAKGKDLLMTELEQEAAVHRRDTLHAVARMLALPYADRPGYLETWKP